MRNLIVLPFLLLALLSGASLAVMTGHRFWPGPLLQVNLDSQIFNLPASFELDPAEISEELSGILATRAQEDYAIRTLLGTEGQTQMADVVVPRLLNAGVIRRLIEDIDGLRTVISVAEYNALVTGQLENRSDLPMEDVALILPGAVLAESVDGQRFTISEPDLDLQSIEFGPLEPGQTIRFNVWFNTVPDPTSLEFFRQVRVGASKGIDGSVSFHGHQDWFGQLLEVVPWARWIVGTILSLSLLGSTAALGYHFLGLFRPKKRRQI